MSRPTLGWGGVTGTENPSETEGTHWPKEGYHFVTERASRRERTAREQETIDG
jgi:hypothetical protein